MASLEDKYNALETVYKMAYALDALNYHDLAASFLPNKPFHFDIFDTLGKPPMDVTVEQFFKTATGSLGGFDRTQHTLSSPVVTLGEGDRANVKVMVNAFHLILGEEGMANEIMTARLTWIMDLMKEDGKWLIVGYQIKGSPAPMDRPEMIAKAHERAAGEKLRAGIVGP